jgi:DNA-binding PadR family transcriptional regulator
LQQAAGLSPGATIPVLRRLLEGGLVVVGKAGIRHRMAYRLAVAGRRRLKRGWKDLIASGPSNDLDANLRVALLAFFIGGNRRLAVEFLRMSAARKLESLGSIDVPEYLELSSRLAVEYSKWQALSAKALIKAEIAAAKAVVRSFPHSTVHGRKWIMNKHKA